MAGSSILIGMSARRSDIAETARVTLTTPSPQTPRSTQLPPTQPEGGDARRTLLDDGQGPPPIFTVGIAREVRYLSRQ